MPSGPTPDSDRLGEAAAADEAQQGLRRLDPMGHRHNFGQDCEVIWQVVGNLKQLCTGQQVHVFRPATEEMRRRTAMQAIAVVLHVLART